VPPIIPRRLLFSDPLKNNPRISPDGKKLAYLSQNNNLLNIYIKTIGEDDDRSVLSIKNGSINTFYFWATDKYIIYLQDTAGNENWLIYKLNIETSEVKCLIPNKEVKVKIVKYSVHFPSEMIIAIYNNPLNHDLYHVDLLTENLTLMEKNPGNIVDWLIDSNLKLRGIIIAKDSDVNELAVKDDEDGSWKTLVSWEQEYAMLTKPLFFSGDNNYLYMIDAFSENTSRLVKIELKTGKIIVMVQDLEYDIYTVLLTATTQPYESHTVLIEPNTIEIQAICLYKFRKEWIVIDEGVKEDFQKIRELDEGDFSIVSRDDNDKIWIISFEKDNGAVSFYMFNRDIKVGTLLFSNNPFLSDYPMSHMEEVVFSARDGLTIHGYITYPPGNKRFDLPMVLFVHGGPWYRDKWGFNPVVQWFTGRGYVCLQVNFRGSIGYGRDFLDAGNKEWGGKMQDDLTDAVNWAIEKGIADSRKVAIYGAGYGGYAALAGAVFTPNLFSCAVAIECPGNLVNVLKSIPPQWKLQYKKFTKRIGDPDREEAFLMSRSPFYKLEEIKIPLLIAYGLNSSRVKSIEPYQVVKTIKSKGIDVEYVVFPDEGHEIAGEQNRMKFYAICEKFLGKHMGGFCEEEQMIRIANSCNNPNEVNMIHKILTEGDRDAFEKLIERYEKPLLKHIFKMTGDFKVGRELVHETFCRVWLYFSSYSFEIPFSLWLFKVATNVVKKYRIKERKLLNNTELDEASDIMVDTWQEILEDRILIETIVNSLKKPYKTSLFLRFTEELDYKEIASLMNTNTHQVKNYLFRAKKAFLKSWRKFYSRENPFSSDNGYCIGKFSSGGSELPG